MSSCHSHHHASADNVTQGRMAGAIGLTLLFVVAEVIAGIAAHSLALVSDAGHNLADTAALGLSWYAIWIAKKPSHAGMTYGYHRVGILAALVNAVSLVVIALLIVWEAITRLRQPQPVSGGVMMAVAAVAIVVNVIISLWLRAGAKSDLNVRSAYLHMVGDALSALGVVIAGAIVLLTGANICDPLVSFLIAALIFYSSWDILKESVNVLLEGAPAGVDVQAVENTIAAVPGVINVHDLHVWTVGPGAIACSCHILVAEQSVRQGQQILNAVATQIEHEFAINHTTVQIEVEGHDQDQQMFCSIHKTQTTDE
jgi:cobalt-zinc-cadmium efflux system protein